MSKVFVLFKDTLHTLLKRYRRLCVHNSFYLFLLKDSKCSVVLHLECLKRRFPLCDAIDEWVGLRACVLEWNSI